MINFFLLFFQHPRKILTNLSSLGWFVSSKRKFRKMLGKNSEFKAFILYPCLTDRKESSGTASGHYFHQDLLVAQKIFAAQPQKHVDVGSRINGFVAHVASFREIEVMDIRPLVSEIPNITFRQMDFMDTTLPNRNYCDSLSCLHAIEHFGLGRYGDPLDPDGHIKGFHNLYRLLKPNGTLYFSAPIGRQRIEFNAHRVFDVSYLLNMFKGKFDTVSFSYVDDKGDLHRNAILAEPSIQQNFGCKWGCGIFELKKTGNADI